MYYVVMDRRVVFVAESMSGAFGWRDGFGAGEVCQVLSEAQERLALRNPVKIRKPRRKQAKTGVE